MGDESAGADIRLDWKYSKPRDVLEIWNADEPRTSATRIQVAGVLLRQLTGNIAIDDLSQQKRSYVLNELYRYPKRYGAKVLSGDA